MGLFISDLSQLSQGIGDEMLRLIMGLKNSANKEVLRQHMEQVKKMLMMIGQVAEELLTEVRMSQSDVVGDQLQDELAAMDRLIEEAAQRIQVCQFAFLVAFMRGNLGVKSPL